MPDLIAFGSVVYVVLEVLLSSGIGLILLLSFGFGFPHKYFVLSSILEIIWLDLPVVWFVLSSLEIYFRSIGS